MPKTDDARGFVATGFKSKLAALLLYLFAMAFSERVKAGSGIFQWLECVPLQVVAWLLMLAGMAITVKSQHELSDSGRIGIDDRAHTRWINSGNYSFSRNPIFISMRLAFLGAFLLVPNGVMLLMFGLGEVFVQVQVGLEEAHFRQAHGQSYETCADQVRR